MFRRQIRHTALVFLVCILSLATATRSHADIIMQTGENGTPFFSDHGSSFFGNGGKFSIRTSKATTDGASRYRFAEAISAAGQTYGLDPKLIRCVISAESDFNKYAISQKGAHGLMQLTIPTAAKLNVKNVYDPY
jgi:soluble lytic murein transglycosylase-like protein